MTLEQLRKKIDTIDNRIVELLAKRFAVVESIGRYKEANNISPLDQQRRNSLLRSLVRIAKQKWLSEALITDLRERIHKETVSLQYKKKSA